MILNPYKIFVMPVTQLHFALFELHISEIKV
jgi:hypothetical protein